MKLKLLLLSFLFLGCSTFHNMAEKYYSEGDYDAAAATYEKILKRDPDDELAKENLRRARQGIIERNLIEARQLRLADHYAESHRKLVGVILKEHTWNLAPAGAAFSAQKEEMEYFFEWLLQQTRLEMKEKKFLKAKLRLDDYEKIFDGSEVSGSFVRLQKDVNAGGTSHCNDLKSMVTGYYSKDFWQRYCMFWGENPNAKNYNLDKNLLGYSEVSLKGKILGLPANLETSLTNAVLAGLKATPFYNPNGKPLVLRTTGTFESNYRETQTEGIHNYDEQEPYQATETVSYQVDEPYTDWETETDPVTHKTKKVPVTKYRSVTKYREETVTRYKTVAKSLRYPKMDFVVNYTLLGSVTMTIDGINHTIPINNQLHVADYFHEASNGRIGLYPKKKNYVTETDWLKSTFAALDSNVSNQVRSGWENKYCKPTPSRSTHSQSEYILKCAAGSSYGLDVIENWSTDMFGLPYAKVTKSIGVI